MPDRHNRNVRLSNVLRDLIQVLRQAREHAFPIPFGGSYWPCLSLADVDTVLVELRACEMQIMQFEELFDTLEAALSRDRAGQVERVARRPTLRVISKEDQP